MPTRVTLLTELRLDRDCFATLLARQPELELVESALLHEGDGAAGAELVVIVIDPAAADAVARATQLAASRPVVVLGARSASVAKRLLAVGARGVVMATQPVDDAVACVLNAARGALTVPVGLDAAPTEPTGDAIATLTPREREVFDLLIAGATNNEVATRLGISPKTADSHRTHVFRKVGVHSIVQLVRLAARHGLLDDDPTGSSSTSRATAA
jgi:DNA-binding NarL/FixJ family response regulator